MSSVRPDTKIKTRIINGQPGQKGEQGLKRKKGKKRHKGEHSQK